MKHQRMSVLDTHARCLAGWLVSLGRHEKRVILAVNDFLLLNLALWLAMSVRVGELFFPTTWDLFVVLGAAPCIGIATFFQMDVYRLVTRFIGGRGVALTAAAVGLSGLYWGLLVYLSGVYSVPRSVVLFYPVLATAFIWGSRQTAASFLRSAGVAVPVGTQDRPRQVLIYGAETTGMQLLEALQSAGSCEAVAFVDPNPTLRGQYVGGLRVHTPERLPGLVKRLDIDEVLLAMPKARRHDRQAALRHLEALNMRVRTLPAIEDVAAGRFTVSDLRPIETEDLLGRDPVPPDPALLARNIAGKSVMVTGAGGSIGSELVRQIVRQAPQPPRAAGAERGASLRDRARGRRADRQSQLARRQAADGRLRAGVGAGCGAGAPDDRGEPRRDHLSRGRLQACADRGAQSCRRPAQQHLRHHLPGRRSGGLRGGAARARLHRQGRAANQRHGREQAAGGDGPAGARGGAQGAHRVRHGALRQRARQLGLGGAALPAPDRGWRAAHRHPSRR